MSGDLRSDLIAAAKHFYDRGWMVGTAGNLSARLPDGSFWITASGRAKGQLTEQDFIRMNSDGAIVEQPVADSRPSAETSIHLAVYNCFPNAKACYHVSLYRGKFSFSANSRGCRAFTRDRNAERFGGVGGKAPGGDTPICKLFGSA